MTFFYDLNKKLAEVASKEQLTEGKKPDFLDVDKDGDKKEPMKKALKDKEKEVKESQLDELDFGPLEEANDEPAEPDSDAVAKRKARDAAARRREEKAEADKDDLSKDIRTVRTKSPSTSRSVAGRAYGGAAQKDDDEEETSVKATGEKRGRGRPKGTKRSIGAKGPGVKSKLLAKGAIKEEEYNLEEAIAQLEAAGYTVEKAPPGAKAERMVKHIKAGYAKDGKLTPKEKSIAYATAWKAHNKGKVEEEGVEEGSTGDYSAKKARAGKDIGKPGKQFAKIAKGAAERYGSKERGEKVAGAVLAKLRGKNESVESDDKAERAGKKVAKDIEYDEKVKDKIRGKKRGAEDDKAERAGKKVAKDIEYDEKKKKVKETTVSGSVAPAAGAGSKSAGGFTFGQGIYDSYNREVEAMISESININASTSSDGMKSLSVTATDEDVMKLAEILKMAGLGATSSATIEVDENAPDWPTNTETNDDALQYAGGLNKPKSTGQTTAPVVNRDPRRGSSGPEVEDELSKMMEMAGISEAKAKPDFLDVDKDGDKEEPMKKALKDKAEKVEESFLTKLWKEFKAK